MQRQLPKQLPVMTRGCPRCGSTRIYSTEDDFICLACSYIVVRPDFEMQRPKKGRVAKLRKLRKTRKLRNN